MTLLVKRDYFTQYTSATNNNNEFKVARMLKYSLFVWKELCKSISRQHHFKIST